MPKGNIINVRLEDSEADFLDRLCEQNERNRSQMIRFLLRNIAVEEGKYVLTEKGRKALELTKES